MVAAAYASAAFFLCALLPAKVFYDSVKSWISPAPSSGPNPLVIQEACQIHARWSDAKNVDVACFNMFEILGSSQDSFFGNANDLAAVLEPVINDESRSESEETNTVLQSWEYLFQKDKRIEYTAEFIPLIQRQKEASKVDCSRPQPTPPGRPKSGPMKKVCGW